MSYNDYSPYRHESGSLADDMRRIFGNRRGGHDGEGYENRAYEYHPQYSGGESYRPNNTIGFNSEPSRHDYGKPHHMYQQEEHEFDKRMDDYFRRLHEGRTRVPESLCTVIAEGVQMYNQSEHGEHGDEEQHHRYKEAIERLREEKDSNAKERLMKELFENLTPDEMVVLREKGKAKSYRELAREKWGNNATAERWVDAMKSLKHKLKLA